MIKVRVFKNCNYLLILSLNTRSYAYLLTSEETCEVTQATGHVKTGKVIIKYCSYSGYIYGQLSIY